MKVRLDGPNCPYSHDFLGKAEVSSQLKDVAANTGAVTKSGAKSKAQLDKEAADAARAEAKEGATSRKLAEDLCRAAIANDPYYVDDDGVDLDEFVSLVIRPEPVEA